MFKGNNFLVKNYKQFAVKDTFRAIVAPRIKSYYENDELFHEIGMIFIEYPPQLDFSSIK
jgi:hypothetical protein